MRAKFPVWTFFFLCDKILPNCFKTQNLSQEIKLMKFNLKKTTWEQFTTIDDFVRADGKATDRINLYY